MPTTTTPARQRQHGAATLIVTMVLLFSTSIIMLYLNRSILFEQKTSANQIRSTLAMEMAEAGMEWAIGMLNTPFDLKANTCDFEPTTKISFRHRYVQTKWHLSPPNGSTNVIPATNTFPGCKIDTNTNTRICSCPTVPNTGTAVADLNSAGDLPGFTVAFSTDGIPSSEEETVRIIVTGCTAQINTTCTPATAGNADATATITSLVKMRPLLRAAPASPLTCGQKCDVGTSYSIINKDVASGGILINAGTDIDGKLKDAVSIPGQPGENALVPKDSSLDNIAKSDPTCSASAMFSSYFGSTVEQFTASPMTTTIANCGSSDCDSLVTTAYEKGWRSFYFPDGFQFSGQFTLGSITDPVTMVSAKEFKITGKADIFGMIFSNTANFVQNGTGSGTIKGALVTCEDYKNTGNGTLEYSADALKNVRRSTGVMVRVPGSWTDKCTASTANPPVITCN